MRDSSAFLRRIQLTGGSTYIVSLPKIWAESMGLKPGDYVRVIPQPDRSLLLVPGREWAEKQLEAVLKVSPESSPEEVTRELIACYLAGYNVIRIMFAGRVDEYKSYLKKIMRTKLIGLESVEESTDYMVLRCLLGYVEFPISDTLNRMYLMALSMCRDALRALKERERGLMRDVIQRDDEVDRLYLFCVRQLKAAAENAILMREVGLKSTRECLGYRLIIKSMERIADHAVGIAEQISLIKLPNNSRIIDKILNMGELSLKIYENAVQSLLSSNIKQANNVITQVEGILKIENELVKNIFEGKFDTETAIGLRLVIESLRRIAEYSADIAEIAINLAIKG
ncbi:MAG: phosphate uptake regulator PhoU [Nitrososphaerota archaeon]|nr:phosphate uptake regulator PhoU [Nitrososphaerota archaeon]